MNHNHNQLTSDARRLYPARNETTMYDFFINRIDDDGEIIVEKRTRRNGGDVTLEQWLEKLDVADREIGRIIESLEALPYGAANEQTLGRNGLIRIKQEA